MAPEASCDRETVFTRGKLGEPYPASCSDREIEAYKAEYNRGFQIYQRIKLVQQQIRDIQAEEKRGSYINAEIKSVSDRLAEINADLASGTGNEAALRTEASQLNAHINDLQNQLAAANSADSQKASQYSEEKNALYQKLDGLRAIQ